MAIQTQEEVTVRVAATERRSEESILYSPKGKPPTATIWRSLRVDGELVNEKERKVARVIAGPVLAEQFGTSNMTILEAMNHIGITFDRWAVEDAQPAPEPPPEPVGEPTPNWVP